MYSSTIKELVEFFETQTVLTLIAAIRLFLLSCCLNYAKREKNRRETKLSEPANTLQTQELCDNFFYM